MSTCRIALACVLAACLLTPAAAQFRQPPPYRILVTSDDGLRTPGIAALAQILQAIGTPIIVAPSENQSGVGHAIVTTDAVMREDVTLANGLMAIGVPCGFVTPPNGPDPTQRLPVGLQLTGRLFDEPTVLNAADAYERLTDWHTQRPA